MGEAEPLRARVRALLDGQRLAVLSTYGQGQPHLSLVAFVFDENLGRVAFVTPRETRKYANLAAHPRVALLIDNRSGSAEVFREAMAVTVVGRARELSRPRTEPLFEQYLARHPELADFARAATSAFVVVAVECYHTVTRFQHVETLRVAR